MTVNALTKTTKDGKAIVSIRRTGEETCEVLLSAKYSLNPSVRLFKGHHRTARRIFDSHK